MSAFDPIAFNQTSFDVTTQSVTSKFEFVPSELRIVVQPGVTYFTAVELYFAWKEWAANNLKYPQAFRTVGGDPVSGVIYVSSYFFLMNGWKVRPQELDHVLTISGNLVSDTDDTVIAPTMGTYNVLVQLTVPVEAQAIAVSGGVSPSALEIRQEIDSNSIKLLQIKTLLNSINIPTPEETAGAVWNAPINTIVDKSTIGGYITRVLLSIPKFLGLK